MAEALPFTGAGSWLRKGSGARPGAISALHQAAARALFPSPYCDGVDHRRSPPHRRRLPSRARIDLHLKFTRLSLGRAHALATSFAQHVQRSGLPIAALVPLGSLRRYAPEMGDVAMLAVVFVSFQSPKYN